MTSSADYQAFLSVLEERAKERSDEEVSGRFASRHCMFDYEGPYPPEGPESSRVTGLSRQELESLFVSAIDEGIEVKEMISLKAQSDLMAAAEKAFRALHMSRAQFMSRGASRTLAMTKPNGVLGALSRLPFLGG